MIACTFGWSSDTLATEDEVTMPPLSDPFSLLKIRSVAFSGRRDRTVAAPARR